MTVNSGKRFESNFKNSVPSDIFCYRFKDGTANFRGARNENVRFQAKNICDYMVYNGKKLFLLELKAHKGKSLPLNCVRKNQVEELTKASVFENIVCGILVYFSDLEEIYFLDIDDYLYYTTIEPNKKSIPFAFFKENGKKIYFEKKLTNLKLNLDNFFKK